MNKFLAASSLAIVLSFAAAADANAWSRTTTVTGRHGTAVITGSGGCAYGVCTRSVARTGAYGRTVSRTSSASCASGVCTATRATTGPRGNTVYRTRTVYR